MIYCNMPLLLEQTLGTLRGSGEEGPALRGLELVLLAVPGSGFGGEGGGRTFWGGVGVGGFNRKVGVRWGGCTKRWGEGWGVGGGGGVEGALRGGWGVGWGDLTGQWGRFLAPPTVV